MDWRSVKFDWNRARAFLVTVEEGSLSAASRALGMTQPTLSRQVAALEDELGVVLFERVGRGLTLTPSGLDLVDHVRSMGDAASRFSLAASGQSQSLEGNVCISASEVDATFRLPSIIANIRREEPGIEIEVVVSQEASDLRRREADIAIRSFQPTEPNLIAKKICDINIHLYATPGYMERAGNPAPSNDLSGLDFIGFDRTDMLIAALNETGMVVNQSNFPIICKFQLLQWELAKQGSGIVIFPQDIGDAEPLVDRAFPDQDPILVVPQWLVCHRELNTSRRVRKVFDLLAVELGKD
ncbi:MAG: LysR family transcriptional regulator [Alphaproteobacteria bacterium]|nr:LysR family transcriptional regulator [Alphaproteobacteria bacterium]